MEKLIANRYSKALFDAGLDLEKTDVFYEELVSIRTILEEEEELMNLLGHPRVTYENKKTVVKNIFQNRISQEIINFLYIIIDKRRQDSIFAIIDGYNELYYEANNILDMTATTAVTMDQAHREKLIANLEASLDKKIRLTNLVDEKILGGVILEANNMRIDDSILGKIDAMRHKLDSIVM